MSKLICRHKHVVLPWLAVITFSFLMPENLVCSFSLDDQKQITDGLDQMEQEFIEILTEQGLPNFSVQEITKHAREQTTKNLIKLKLRHMVKKDQYVRNKIVAYIKKQNPGT